MIVFLSGICFRQKGIGGKCCEGDRIKHGVFVDCSEGFYYFEVLKRKFGSDRCILGDGG